MTDIRKSIPSEVAGYDTGDLEWKQLLGTPRLGYHVDYSIVLAEDRQILNTVLFDDFVAGRY